MNEFTIKDARQFGPYSEPEITKTPFHYSPEELIRIATLQKLLMWIVVVMVPLAYFPIQSGMQIAASLAVAVLHVLGMVAACKLARTMRHNVWLWVFATVFPFANLVAFSRITLEATFTLRFNGIRTGLLGASRREMQRFDSAADSTTTVWKSPLHS